MKRGNLTVISFLRVASHNFFILSIITLWVLVAGRSKNLVPVTAFCRSLTIRRVRPYGISSYPFSFSTSGTRTFRTRLPHLNHNWKAFSSTMRQQLSLTTNTLSEESAIINHLKSCLEGFSDESLILDACNVMEQTSTIDTSTSTDLCPDRLGPLSLAVANQLCQIACDPSRKRKATWTELQEYAQQLLPTTTSPDAKALAISLIFGVLALTHHPGAKAAASALATTVSSSWTTVEAASTVPGQMLHVYLQHSIAQVQWNWNTLTQFTRAFDLSDQSHPQLPSLVAQVIQLQLEQLVPIDEIDDRKQVVSGILALACQVKPWSSGKIPPLLLVQAAIPLDYWHAAESICQSATNAPELSEAVEYLIDTAMEERTYRRADTLATNLYDVGGRSRYIQARYQHACDTISQVVYKRQLPIIERQVSRVDKAVARAEQDPYVVVLDKEDKDTPKEIRLFALMRLEEAGEHDAAHRLATLWELDYVFDADAIKAAAAVRKQTYLQFEEVLTCPIPDVVSDPDTLRRDFDKFWKNGPYPQGPFGMDAEWEEDAKGVDLLQLSHRQQAILIDIPALVSSFEGRLALEETVGVLLDSSDTVVVGFACRQDLSRLRQNSSWLKGTQAVVDMQPLVVQKEPQLAAISSRVGLARVCQHFFGKPLDKSEQCSFWGARPLSLGQRSYAALDAWVCAAAYEILQTSGN